MKFTRILMAATTCVVLTACAGMQPNARDLSTVPIINFGQPLPEGKDYVLHFPAGTPLPVSVLVGGSLFENDDQTTLHVTLKHEVFVYQKYTSFDGQNWKRGRELIETKLELQIPQKVGNNAGLLQLKLDQK